MVGGIIREMVAGIIREMVAEILRKRVEGKAIACKKYHTHSCHYNIAQ